MIPRRPVDGALIEQERRAARNAVLGNVVLFMTAIALIKFGKVNKTLIYFNIIFRIV